MELPINNISKLQKYWDYLALRDEFQTRLLWVIDEINPDDILDWAGEEVFLQAKSLEIDPKQFREKFIKVYLWVRFTRWRNAKEVIKTQDDLNHYLDTEFPGFRVAFESIILKQKGIAPSWEELFLLNSR